MKRKTLAICGLVFMALAMGSCMEAMSNLKSNTQGPTLRR